LTASAQHPETPKPPRTVSIPNLYLSLCVWKPLKTHGLCFFIAKVAIYSLVHFKTNRGSVKQGKCGTLSNFSTSFSHHCWRSVCRSLTNSCKFALLLFTALSLILNTSSSAALVIITQNAFPARPLRTANSKQWSRHHWRMSPQQLCQIQATHAAQ